jgi:hypothetical protein
VNRRIAAQRLDNQRIAQPGPRDPAEIVAWFGAVQAQDHPAAAWALALRVRDGWTGVEIGRALDEGRILRTHVMRPTWHFVTPSDIYWMLELTAPRVHQALAYANRHYELDRPTRIRAMAAFERALTGGQYLTRSELGVRLARAGIAAQGVRLALLTLYAELEGVMCSGPRRGKQSTYALLAERVPRARRLSRDESIAELTRRYFRSHGPATARDFIWCCGLTTADAKRGLEVNGARSKVVEGLTYWTVDQIAVRGTRRRLVHLLPIYDEYLVAYRDHEAVPRKAGSRGTLQPAVIIAGQVAGTWKLIRKTDGFAVDVSAHRRLTDAERGELGKAVNRYGCFLDTKLSLSVR